MSLKAKVALITGGSRGIGRSVAISLAAQGVHVAINYLRNQSAAEETARRVRKHGRRVLLLRRSVVNPDDVKAMFQEIEKAYGRLDIFVHCAALTVFKPLIELTPTQLGKILDINATSFVTCSQEARKLMRNGGVIIAMSSLGSQRYINGYGGIGIAKACLEAAVRYLAVELSPKGIRVNGVSGGPVETEGIRMFPHYEDHKKECVRLTPAGRIAMPEDISRVIVFLCKEESAWVQGQTVIADGGLSLRLISL